MTQLSEMPQLSQADLSGKTVLVRCDLNVPIHEGQVTSTQRLDALLPTIHMLLAKDVSHILLLSHLGRPSPDVRQSEYNMDQVAALLGARLGMPINVLTPWPDKGCVPQGLISVCDNIRYQSGETENDPALVKAMLGACDVVVMEAFATAHRRHASTYGLLKAAKEVYFGPLFLKELEVVSGLMLRAQKPVLAVIGGSKISTKLGLLASMVEHVDYLIVGGGMANTLLKAQGVDVGASLVELDWVPRAKEILQNAKKHDCVLLLPKDVRVAKGMNAEVRVSALHDITSDEAIYDIGPHSEALFHQVVGLAQTVIWNGPLGVFEYPAFAHGTEAMMRSIVQSSAYKVVGGGDTLAAIASMDLSSRFDFLSTGGGAFLSYLEQGTLPALEALNVKEVVS